MDNSKRLLLFFFITFLILPCLAASQEQKPKALAIIGARLIDGTGAPPQNDMVIIIEGDRFAAIGPKGKVTIPQDAGVMDVQGKTVIPGLIDTHVHFTYPPSREESLLDNDAIAAFRAAHFLHRHLMVGVTTVRDVISRTTVGVVTKKAYREKLFIGSRPIVVGQGITCTGGHGTEHGSGRVMEVDGPAEFRRAVRQQIKAGAALIKVLPPYSREEVRAAIQETHALGRFVTVHAGRGGLMVGENYDFIRWAVEDGADCVEHAYAIPDDVIKMMAKKKIYCVPTVYILLKIAEDGLKRHGDKRRVERFLESPQIFKKMKNAGVKMGVGTDAVLENMVEYPWIYFQEIEHFVEFGYTPLEAIQAATKINAEICNAAQRLGTIEKGKLADLLVYDGDPLKDIKVLRNAQIIIQEGNIIKR